MENRKRRNWNEDSIGRVFGIMDEVLYSMALYREIRPWERDNKVFDPELRKFWLMISNNAILMTVINWCKVFGAEKNKKTNYSRYVDAEHFRTELKGISFEDISERMRNIRDKFAVHEDDYSKRKPIPEFDPAIQVMEAFTRTVQQEYDIPDLPPIRGCLEAYKEQIRNCLRKCEIDWTIPNSDD